MREDMGEESNKCIGSRDSYEKFWVELSEIYH